MKPKPIRSVRSCSKGRKEKIRHAEVWASYSPDSNCPYALALTWKFIFGDKRLKSGEYFLIPASIAKKMIKKLGGRI